MTRLRLVGLVLATGLGVAAAPTSARSDEGHHTIRVDHHAGPVDARYRGVLQVTYVQAGAAAPAGRASTLSCRWQARLDVTRQAMTRHGHRLERSMSGGPIATGSRHGWCSGQRDAIARDVAARTIDLDRHLRALAREDHDRLRAELDRIHGVARSG